VRIAFSNRAGAWWPLARRMDRHFDDRALMIPATTRPSELFQRNAISFERSRAASRCSPTILGDKILWGDRLPHPDGFSRCTENDAGCSKECRQQPSRGLGGGAMASTLN